MKIINCADAGSSDRLRALYNRPDCPKEIEDAVSAIVDEVRRDGDAAVCRFLKKFDSQDLTPEQLRVTPEEFAAAEAALDEESKKAIHLALDHIQDFARHQMPKAWTYSPREGVVLGEQFTPMERVGCYIPGGTAPLVSTVLHTAGIAAAAGVPEIVAATPPKKDGSGLIRYTLIAGLAGALLVIAILAFLYIKDDKINTADDVEQYLGLTVLAMIPVYSPEDAGNNPNTGGGNSRR